LKLIVNKKYGLKNFYWPISHKEFVFSMKMFFNLIKNSQNYFYQNDKDNFNIFSCLKILLCDELLDLYLKKKLFFLEKKYKHQKIFTDHKSGYNSKKINEKKISNNYWFWRSY